MGPATPLANKIINSNPQNSNSNIEYSERVIKACSGQLDKSAAFILPDGRVAQACPLQLSKPITFIGKNTLSDHVNLHYRVKSYMSHNYCGARISLSHTTFNIPVWRRELEGSKLIEIADYLEFGFPLGVNYSLPIESTLNNHTSGFVHFNCVDISFLSYRRRDYYYSTYENI